MKFLGHHIVKNRRDEKFVVEIHENENGLRFMRFSPLGELMRAAPYDHEYIGRAKSDYFDDEHPSLNFPDLPKV